MKTLFKSMVIAGAVVMTAACGGSDKQAQDSKAAVDTTPTVSVEQVTRRDVPQEVVYSTTVQAFVKNNIAPQSVNRIAEINVEIGDFVKEGQVLAEIDKAQLLQAQLQLQNQEVELQRLKALFEEGGLSQSDYDAIQLQYNVLKTQVDNLLENTTLIAPISGIVTARNYDKGDMAGGLPILVIEQIRPVKIMINISEALFAKVRKGMKVSITLEAYGDEKFEGSISRIYPTINNATRTFQAEVTIPNNDERVRPGMFARVTLPYEKNNRVVAYKNGGLVDYDIEEALAMKKDIDEFVGEADQFDDITMLCLEYKEKMKPSEEDAQ